MIATAILSILLLTSLAAVLVRKNEGAYLRAVQLIMLALVVVAATYAFLQQHSFHAGLTLLSFNGISLTIAIQYDMLTKIMVTFILLIGLLIYRYASNYLASDSTRLRFLSQFNLVLVSVSLLVMAENLLTAFVAWQLISLNLYLLLNHYHHDAAANRAAKKKFVINRVGDCSFLLAIILAYHSNSAASFASLQHSAHAALICTLLFISVMTKCAQFPFHSWLLDTMETPTPVSALMHAGVINAGGILLTRVSASVIRFAPLNYFILAIGLISAVLSVYWMNQQPDTKKKLAYSTMGQMGYMLTQCSLGAFPAAVFHLISHGFYKASLFLNAGETLPRKTYSPSKISFGLFSKALLVSLIIFAIGFTAFQRAHTPIPLLIYGFIFLTLMNLIVKTEQRPNKTWRGSLVYYCVFELLLLAYLSVFQLFCHLLPQYAYASSISWPIQLSVFIILFALQCIAWSTNKKFIIKDRTEAMLRRYLLNPLRATGDAVNSKDHKSGMQLLYTIAMLFTVLGFIYALFAHKHSILTHGFNSSLTLLFLLVGIVTLTFANRCLSIKRLITYLVLFELAFTNIALFDGSSHLFRIGLFHIINVGLALIMMSLLSRNTAPQQTLKKPTNMLPTRVFYLVFSLLLLIGIPGTASFISEFYLLSSLVTHGPVLTIAYIVLIILIAIVIMHSLQLYAFNDNYVNLLSRPISKQSHWFFLLAIAINIACGLWPGLLLQQL